MSGLENASSLTDARLAILERFSDRDVQDLCAEVRRLRARCQELEKPAQYSALLEALEPWRCCGAPPLCGVTCQDDELSATLAKAYELIRDNDA